MQDILDQASVAIREAQLRAGSSGELDALAIALDVIEGDLPSLVDLLHDLRTAYAARCADPGRDPLLARAGVLLARLQRDADGQAPLLAVDEVDE